MDSSTTTPPEVPVPQKCQPLWRWRWRRWWLLVTRRPNRRPSSWHTVRAPPLSAVSTSQPERAVTHTSGRGCARLTRTNHVWCRARRQAPTRCARCGGGGGGGGGGRRRRRTGGELVQATASKRCEWDECVGCRHEGPRQRGMRLIAACASGTGCSMAHRASAVSGLSRAHPPPPSLCGAVSTGFGVVGC